MNDRRILCVKYDIHIYIHVNVFSIFAGFSNVTFPDIIINTINFLLYNTRYMYYNDDIFILPFVDDKTLLLVTII